MEEKYFERGKTPPLDQFYIDVGAKGKTACPVKVGDAAGFSRPFEDLGDRLVAKTMDDRVACAILIETLRKLRRCAHDVYFVFTVQEEMTLAGAGTSAYGINPDMALAVDVTGTGDTPESVHMAVALGGGPAIKVQDSGMVAHAGVKELMVRRAEEAKLSYQLEVLTSGTTDAMAIQMVREGIPTGCLSIPCRYIHSPSEMVDYGDVQNSVKLLLAILAKPIEV
jgi:endoglucanase